MLPQTLDHLRVRNLLDSDRADRTEIAKRCQTMLLEKPVESDDLDEIQEKAALIQEIRYRVLGESESLEVEAELDDIIRGLVSADGKVQEGLENGYVLCSATVSRRLGRNGTSITIRRRGRFVTSNADAIEEFFWTPATSRLHNAMKMVARRLELGARRQPALQARKPAQIAKAYEQIQLELPRGEEA